MVHSISNAEKEAQRVFQNVPNNTGNSIHIIYGLGLGYLFEQAVESSKGNVILYEPNIELMRVVLEIVDVSKSLSKSNIHIASNIDELKTIYNKIYRFNMLSSLSYLDFYKQEFAVNIQEFENELQILQSIYEFNHKFHSKTAYSFLDSILKGFERKVKLPCIDKYADIFKNKPAIIVSAGPSLLNNIDTIKKYRNNAVIFSVGAALRTLQKYDITPDFANIIERVNAISQFDLPITRNTNIISEPFTNENIFDVDAKRYFLSLSTETAANHWFAKTTGLEMNDFETKGTVSYQALCAAKLFGCNPIILVGQDLAYTGGKFYAQGSVFDCLECVKDEKTNQYKVVLTDYEKYRKHYREVVKLAEDKIEERIKKRLEVATKGLSFVEGQNGEKLPTDPGYALFIQYFQDFAAKHKSNIKLINSSTGGALIKGFENLSLDEALKPYANMSFNVENILKKCDFTSIYRPDLITCKLRDELGVLNETSKILNKGEKLVKELKESTEAARAISTSNYKKLKTCLNMYINLSDNYRLKNFLYKLISTRENDAIAWLLREETESPDFEAQLKLINALCNYFERVLIKNNSIIEKIKLILENIDESCCTKS